LTLGTDDTAGSRHDVEQVAPYMQAIVRVVEKGFAVVKVSFADKGFVAGRASGTKIQHYPRNTEQHIKSYVHRDARKDNSERDKTSDSRNLRYPKELHVFSFTSQRLSSGGRLRFGE